MRELSVAEQRYQAVLAVISDGETVNHAFCRVRGGELLGSLRGGVMSADHDFRWTVATIAED